MLIPSHYLRFLLTFLVATAAPSGTLREAADHAGGNSNLGIY